MSFSFEKILKKKFLKWMDRFRLIILANFGVFVTVFGRLLHQLHIYLNHATKW